MPDVNDVLLALEEIAPSHLAFDFDKIGLQVGSRSAQVSKAVVSLDRSLGAIREAKHLGAELLVAHHPLIFSPIERVVESDEVGQSVSELISSGISFVAAHTNWDCAVGGVNDVLADLLSLQDVSPFGSSSGSKNLKLVVFSPEESVERLMDDLAKVGAGVIGNYSRCGFMTKGTGTFIGNERANPAVGIKSQVEAVNEIRIEMILDASLRKDVESLIQAVHPYETPAFDFYELHAANQMPAGRIGQRREPISLSKFAESVERILSTKVTAWGTSEKKIESVAVVGGAADSDWCAALKEGADVFVTGEVRQHNALSAVQSGIAMIAAGHFATEQPGAAELAARLCSALPEIEWHCFEPNPGEYGRPL